MKWMKRIFYTAVVLVLAGVALLFGANELRKRKPEWYPAGAPDAGAISAAANRMTQKMAGIQAWVASSHAQQSRKVRNTVGPTGDVDGNPDPSKTIELTEEEFNAFFNAWDKNQHWSDRYDQHIADPVLVLQDDRIILAATVKEADTIVSVHLEPRLDEKGMLRLRIVRVMGGRMPLPQAFWDRYRQTVSNMMIHKLDQLRPAAQIRDDGAANPAAVGAAMNRLLLHAINDEPAEPVLFLPRDYFAVKLTELKVKDKTFTMTVAPMTADERAGLIGRIRAPFGSPQAEVTASAK